MENLHNLLTPEFVRDIVRWLDRVNLILTGGDGQEEEEVQKEGEEQKEEEKQEGEEEQKEGEENGERIARVSRGEGDGVSG